MPLRRGFSLLELLLVISVGTTLIMSGLSAYKTVNLNLQISQIQQLMMTMQVQIEWSYGSRNFYPNGNMLDDLVGQRVFPSQFAVVGSGNSMYARLPMGIYEITGNVQSYAVSISGLPDAACIRIGSLYTPLNNEKLLTLSVNGDIYDAKRSGDFDGLRNKLISGCNPGNANRVIWTFR